MAKRIYKCPVTAPEIVCPIDWEAEDVSAGNEDRIRKCCPTRLYEPLGPSFKKSAMCVWNVIDEGR